MTTELTILYRCADCPAAAQSTITATPRQIGLRAASLADLEHRLAPDGWEPTVDRIGSWRCPDCQARRVRRLAGLERA